MDDDNEIPDHYIVTPDGEQAWIKDYIEYIHGDKEWPKELPRSRLITKQEAAAVFGMHHFFYARERTRWEKFLAKIHLLNVWFKYSNWRNRARRNRTIRRERS